MKNSENSLNGSAEATSLELNLPTPEKPLPAESPATYQMMIQLSEERLSLYNSARNYELESKNRGVVISFKLD